VKPKVDSLKKRRRTIHVVTRHITHIFTGKQSFLLICATFASFLKMLNAQEEAVPGPVQ
tara:strand:+ start:1260 stop:1436 length:177 start_codon:yes stop_codon:yes gene_type:complete